MVRVNYFDDIININDLNLDSILLDKNHTNIFSFMTKCE